MPKSRKTPKRKVQMAEMIALSQVTGHSVDTLQEMALEYFLNVEAPLLASKYSVSLSALKKRAAGIPDSDVDMWTPLWQVLQDGYDQAIEDEGTPESGDPGSLGNYLEGISEDAGVGLMHTLRAAFYCFGKEHGKKFIADPYNRRYRVLTPEEEEVAREIAAEYPELGPRCDWSPEDHPSFHRKLRQRIDDTISGLGIE